MERAAVRLCCHRHRQQWQFRRPAVSGRRQWFARLSLALSDRHEPSAVFRGTTGLYRLVSFPPVPGRRRRLLRLRPRLGRRQPESRQPGMAERCRLRAAHPERPQRHGPRNSHRSGVSAPVRSLHQILAVPRQDPFELLMKPRDLAEPLHPVDARTRRAEPRVLSCIVPAFNEADGLSQFLKDLHEIAHRLCPHVEIILVDDGSEDETPIIAAGLVHALGLRYIRLSRNFGKEAALTAGIDRAQGDAVLVIDADYQHPLEVLPLMLEHWRQGYDVVYGVRRSRADEGTIKRIGTRLLYNILSADAPVPIPV